jgi:hypothetical protein
MTTSQLVITIVLIVAINIAITFLSSRRSDKEKQDLEFKDDADSMSRLRSLIRNEVIYEVNLQSLYSLLGGTKYESTVKEIDAIGDSMLYEQDESKKEELRAKHCSLIIELNEALHKDKQPRELLNVQV